MDAQIVVNGAAGRMGRLVWAALRDAGLGPVQGCDRAAGHSSSEPSPITADLAAAVQDGGVIVDFSHPSATRELLEAAEKRGARLVVGTTGQSQAELALLRRAAERVPVVLSRNFSLGIQRMLQLLPEWRVLLEDGFDVECLEAHHRAKRDAPSGTAQALLEALWGDLPKPPQVHGRFGPEAKREVGEVGVHSLRLGGVAGEHALFFGSDHEVIEIRHRALDRTAFVSGVVPAVRFVRQSVAGLYSMLDVMRDATTAVR